ncbi:DUF3099 domain-containing protein [Ornithinimicrobium cerasi]|uniref:DUF3099 domain-containing protein n=1 Tax=Ornithinimicrobium cerasi TaxID=2248773 RepID=UPI000EFE3CA8|nr:DUF3099 domain-containing protein [Ornithinimicrobium cerasi]
MPSNPARPGPARRPAQAVTSTRRSQEDDRQHRMRSYLVAMGLRTVSFPIAVWAFVNDHLVVGWVFVVLAVVIPSIAVMLANAVDRRGTSQGAAPLSPVQGLGPADPAPAPGPPKDARARQEDVIVGTVVTLPVHDAAPVTEPPRAAG